VKSIANNVEYWRILAIVRTAICVSVLLAMAAGPAASKRYNILEGDSYDLDVSTLRGLRLRVKDPEIELRVGGRLHGDLNFIEDDRTSYQSFDSEVRRGRIYLRGRFFEDFGFKIEREFANHREGWRNLWLRYKPTRSFSLKVGNFVAPFGLDDVNSSNYSTLMERSTSSSLAASYQTGIRLDLNGKIGKRRSRNRWTWSLAGLTSPLGQSSDDNHRSEHVGFATRATFAPIARNRRVLHFGIATEYRKLVNGSGYRIRARPESGMDPALFSTGTLRDVNSVVCLGIEAAGIIGSFTVQGEYMRSFLQRDNGRSDLSFDGGYVQVSYVLTGERRRYSRTLGVIRGLKPSHKWGAFEVAARFSSLDLDDKGVSGGRARDLTLGLNWYLRENARVMFNYVRVDGKRRGASPRSDDPQVYQIRFQLFF
jgi:phosphate-selective porin OprO/OprP